MHLDVSAMRAASRERAAARERGPELFRVDDVIVPDTPGVRARHYRPAAERRPLLVYLHGGFWVLGGLESHDRLCRRIADAAGIEVLAVDYRLAPEHPWPAAVDDAIAAVRWAASWLAADRAVGIGGDSAGGCVAALAALALRDEPGGPRLAAQILVCPNTDLTGTSDSMRTVSADRGLDPAAVRAAASLWMPTHARHADGTVSPLHADSLADLPPSIVITAEHDPLRDEGDAYATRLTQAGIPTIHRREPDTAHGFTLSDEITDATKRLFADIATTLRG